MKRSAGLKRTPWKRKPAAWKPRKPWKRKPASPLKRTPLRKRSKAKSALVRQYEKAKAERMARQVAERGCTWCERCQRPREVDGHHPGGQNGKRILVFFLLCRECHDWCHFTDPTAAREEGWLE